MTELWIVQPYVPSYRVPFFEGLRAVLGAAGVSLRVVAGRPEKVQRQRGDAATPPWLTQANGHVVRLFGRSATLTWTRPHWRNADAVVVPHMGSSLDALSALMRKSGRKVGVWGHIASYTSAPNPIDQAIERWQLRQADQVFAYTPGGARYALECGVPREKTTVVMNATDTRALVANIGSLTDDDVAEFRRAHNIPTGRTFAYLGGLDASKRVDFLAAVLDELHLRGSDVHIIVCGSGAESHLLNEARRRGQVTMLGYVQGVEKAAVLKLATAVVNPGRVGLLAVDALAAGRPVLTTDWKYHAPEIEYLERGTSVLVSEDSVEAFAALIDSHAPSFEETPRRAIPTIDAMVSNFARGVEVMLER